MLACCRRGGTVGGFPLRLLDLRESSLTQFTEDGEREMVGGVDEERERENKTIHGEGRERKTRETIWILYHYSFRRVNQLTTPNTHRHEVMKYSQLRY